MGFENSYAAEIFFQLLTFSAASLFRMCDPFVLITSHLNLLDPLLMEMAIHF